MSVNEWWKKRINFDLQSVIIQMGRLLSISNGVKVSLLILTYCLHSMTTARPAVEERLQALEANNVLSNSYLFCRFE